MLMLPVEWCKIVETLLSLLRPPTGGRYDALLARLWPAAAVALGGPPGAVGITLSADRLVAAVSGATASGFRPERAGMPPRPSQVTSLHTT